MKVKTYIVALIVSIIGFNTTILNTVSAQEAFPGIYSFAGCTGLDCSACNVVDMVNGGLNWLIGILFVVFAVLMAIAGVKLVTSGGNPGALNAAKDSFVNAIIGLIIILSAWLIVDTIMRGLVGGPGNEGSLKVVQGGAVTGWLAWSEVECYEQVTPHFEEVQDFGFYGTNSFQAYVHDPINSCKTTANASLPDIALCQSALASLGPADRVYVVQDCSGATNVEPEPAWNSQPLCGGGVSGGSDKILTLSGGGTVEVLPCEAGAADRRTVNFLGGSAHVHKNLVPSLQRINAAWLARGGHSFYRVTSVGGYNCRNIAGTSRRSIHSYGLAIDINPAQNPPGQTLITNMPPEFVNLFKSEGWGWGGEWRSSKDAMHYSKDKGERGDMRGQ